MEPAAFLLIIVLIVSLNFGLERWLDYLNRRHQKAEVPAELEDIYDEDKYRQSLAYQQARGRFAGITATFSFVLSLILLLSGLFGWLDTQLRPFFENPIWLSLVYFGILYLASDLLTLPFQLYSTFVIEQKFGFNRMKLSTFWADKLKGYLLTVLLGGGLGYLFLYLITEIGSDFWLYFWGVAALLMVLLNMFYTSIFVPMFNKLRPLEEGELKHAIEGYSRKVDFPIKNVFVIDGSKRSSKSNAFFSGIGRQKKVVLYDTLIGTHTTEELVSVIAHEVGHYKKKHIFSGMLLSVLQLGFTLYLLSLLIFSEPLSLALGAGQAAIHLNLIAFGILFSPVSTLTGLLMNVWSRRNEYEADAYAAGTYQGSALAEALKKLSVHNMSNLYPHPWYVFFHYSHPPLLSRLHAIRKQPAA